MPHFIQSLAHWIGDQVFQAAGDNQDSLYFSIFGRTMIGYITLLIAATMLAGGAYERLAAHRRARRID